MQFAGEIVAQRRAAWRVDQLLRRERGDLYAEQTAGHEELAGGPELRHDFARDLPDGRLDRFSVSRYDAATQLMEMRLFYERHDGSGMLENRRAHDLTIRVTNRDELDLMLRMAGFEVEAVYGGFEGEPFDSASDHLVVLARR